MRITTPSSWRARGGIEAGRHVILDVIARFRRAIQYAAAYPHTTVVSEYWIARSSRAMTVESVESACPNLVIASAAKQSRIFPWRQSGCFVASALVGWVSAAEAQSASAARNPPTSFGERGIMVGYALQLRLAQLQG
ncbi:hypothetical protein XH98_09505 [Bradyrhizobium sp. CCBAU 51745]|nr:hypothetical protein [Bradyrhizobium sp. CCBAU 51745]